MAGGAENLDSLENNIKRHNDLIESTTKEIVELERSWLSKQTEMVSVLSDIEKLTNKNEELNSRISLLTQQKFRLEADQISGRNDIKLAQQQNVDLRKDTVKLNSLISAGSNQQLDLQNANYTLETVHYDELKSLDDECNIISGNIAELKTAKLSLVDDIKEIDRQTLLWDKKLQLEKEMKQALDPLMGQDDMIDMEKEIHRMILRLEAIKKHQQSLSIEMENAVLKKDAISIRYNKSQKFSKTQNVSTLSTVSKAITTATNDFNSWELKVQDKTNELTYQKSKLSEISNYFVKLEVQAKELSDNIHQNQIRNREAVYLKQVVIESAKCCQVYLNQIKTYEHDEKINESTVHQKGTTTDNMAKSVSAIIKDLQASCPHLKEILERINEMSDVTFLSNL